MFRSCQRQTAGMMCTVFLGGRPRNSMLQSQRQLASAFRWPFVSRAHFEDVVKLYEKNLTDTRTKETLYEKILTDKDVHITDLKDSLLKTQGNFGIAVGNRPLVEIGLARKFKGNTKLTSLTARWEQFAKDYVFKDRNMSKLTQEAIDIINTLDCNTTETNVKKELETFIHQLSKEHHHLDNASGLGIVCGGKQPLGCAVGLVVNLLQKQGCIDTDVRFLDENSNDRKLLHNSGAIMDVHNINT